MFVFYSNNVFAQDFVWAKSVGSTGFDAASALTIDELGNIYCTGFFEGTVDFDPGIGVYNLTSNTHVIDTCASYTWNGVTYTNSNNTARDTLVAINGCDSIVTLDLTINTVNTNTTLTGLTISSDAVGATYQWLDCNNNFAGLPMATNQSFTPAQNGDYAVVVTENNCVDTSACVSVTVIAVNTLADKNAIKVYPNPTQQTIYIDLGEREDVSIAVYSADGKLVQEELAIQRNLHQMELPKMAGVYLLKITTSQGNSYHKVIRE